MHSKGEERQNSSWGILIIGLGLSFLTMWERNFVMQVPMYNIFNKMNFDLAYFDVSYNIKILHLNDSNEFENEIKKQMEKKIKPMKPSFETLNLGNDENPRLIKIGSTLNEKERKDLKDFFTEFQEVFAWSYEDIPSIDPEIA